MSNMPSKTTLKKTVPNWYLTQAEWVEKAKDCGLVGHEHVIAELYFDYIAYMSGMHFKDSPITARVLAGPTGTGKTKLVQTLAHMLHGDPRKVLRIDCAEYQHSHDVAKLVGCFSPDTQVLMGDGSRKKIKDILITDQVVSGNGVSRSVLDTHTYHHSGKMNRLWVSFTNIPTECTPDHKILAIKAGDPSGGRIRNPQSQYDKSKLGWIKAKDLIKGDIVVYPRYKSKNVIPDPIDLHNYIDGARYRTEEGQLVSRGKTINQLIHINEDFMRFVGYYVSDGGGDGGRISLTFGTGIKDKALEDACDVLPKVFGNECEFTIEDRTERNSNRLWFHSVVVCNLMRSLFGAHTLTKKVPEWFFDLPDNLLYAFIDAAFMGDGGKSVDRRIDYSTSSPQLAHQMELILRRLGYATQMQFHEVNRAGWADRYRIYIAGPQIEKLVQNLPVVGEFINLKLDEERPVIQRQSFVDEEYIYFRITSNEEFDYNGPVYDISVDQEPNYVLSNITVSNSPPGYLGHRETTPLLSMSALNNLRSERTDVSIVLFDEFEKAHDSLYRLLLGVLDYGKMTMGDNISVVFNKTMVFFTTNIGVKVRANSIGLEKTPPPESSKKTVLVELKKRFSAEFLNRLGGDSQIHYLELITKDQLKEIAKLELEKLSAALYKALRVFIASIDDKVFDFILDTSQASEYAGRGIEKIIDKVIKPAIIQYIIENRPVTPITLEKTAITLNYDEGLVVEAENYA